MKVPNFIFLLFFSFNYVYSQTNEIILGKRFENFKFDETTYRHVKKHFKGKNKTIEKGIGSVRTVNNCYSQKYITITYYDIGLAFEFKQNIKTKKYLLNTITLDSLSKDYINYSLMVNSSKTNKVVQTFGPPKTITYNNEMIFGTRGIIFTFDKDSVIKKIVINSNKIINQTESGF